MQAGLEDGLRDRQGLPDPLQGSELKVEAWGTAKGHTSTSRGAGQPGQAGLGCAGDTNLAGTGREAGVRAQRVGIPGRRGAGSKGAAGRRPAIGWRASAQALAVQSVRAAA